MSFFPSTLIISSSPENTENKIKEMLSELHHQLTNNPDLFVFEEYNIATVRQAKKFLSQKPFNHDSKIILIPQADNLNSESQNALLKSLEEPGDNNYLILAVSNPTRLLATIISRCQKVRLLASTNSEKIDLWPITGNFKKDLDLSTTLASDKDQIKTLLQKQLDRYHQTFAKNPQKTTAKIIQKLIKSINLIDSNVDPKSALDYFFLK